MTDYPQLIDSVATFLGSKRPMMIGEKWVLTDSVFDVFNPATGDVLAQVSDGSTKEVDAAVAAARKAFKDAAWRRMPPAERTNLLWKLADLLVANE